MFRQTITLVSSDNECYEVSRDVALKSETIAKMIDGNLSPSFSSFNSYSSRHRASRVSTSASGQRERYDHSPDAVNVRLSVGSILKRVIEYCKFHIEATEGSSESAGKTEEEIKAFDTEYMRVEQSTLYELILVRFSLFHNLTHSFTISLFVGCQLLEHHSSVGSLLPNSSEHDQR